MRRPSSFWDGPGQRPTRLRQLPVRGTFPHSLRLLLLRPSEPQVARPLPGVRRVELAARGGARARRPRAAASRPRAPVAVTRLGDVDVLAAARLPDRHRRARPGARRRPRARVARPDRRRARGRQELAAPAGAGGGRGGRRPHPARLRRGVARPGAAAGRAARRRRRHPRAGRHRPRHGLRHDRGRGAGGVRGRLGADASEAPSSSRPPAASPRCARRPSACCGWQSGGATAIVLVGHVTKDGTVAGPRVLEHLVDAVLQFEGDRYRHLRVLRAVKNRFGSTDEIGIFEMTDAGLEPVTDPSAALAEPEPAGPGSVLLPAIEGTRPIVLEMQALVAPSDLAMPRRQATGLRPQPALDDRRRARPPRRRCAGRVGHLRERRRRRARRRARRRPGGRARDRLVGARPGGPAPARLLRRARPHRAGAAGLAHRPAPGRGGQAGRLGRRLPAGHDRGDRRAAAALRWYSGGSDRAGIRPRLPPRGGHDRASSRRSQGSQDAGCPAPDRAGHHHAPGPERHPARAPGRADRDRRAGGAVVHVLGRDPARPGVLALPAVRARQDGRGDHPERGRDPDRVRKRAADARPDHPVGRDGHAAPHGRARRQADRARS